MDEEASQKDRSDDIELGPMARDGELMLRSIEAGNMVAILSKTEVMYTFLYRNQYQCFIHPLGAPEGRRKAWERNEKNSAVIKNLSGLADQLFEIKFKPDMDFMGVMVTAEKGIIGFLDMIGILPAEDHDFMEDTEALKGKKEEQL